MTRGDRNRLEGELYELASTIAEFEDALPARAAELRREAREKLEEIIREVRRASTPGRHG